MTMMPAGMYAQTVPVYAADTDVADSGQVFRSGIFSGNDDGIVRYAGGNF